MRLGIDIGTDVARAAYIDQHGRPQLVRSADGSGWLPALVRQTMHGLQVGAAAARSLVGNTETTVAGCVRLMGRARSIPAHLIERLPYQVHEVNGELVCNLLYAEHPAHALYGELIQALVAAAEQQCGVAVEHVVLTVPAGAEDRFRLQARQAAAERGVSVQRLLNQPTAALMAAQLPERLSRVAVVSCGGGATDVSLAQRTAQGIQIVATAGDPTLGGDDLIWTVTERLNAYFQQQAAVDVFAAGQSRAAAMGLRAAAAEVLNILRTAPQTTLVLDHGGGFGRDLMTIVRRDEVEHWLQAQMERMTALCKRVLKAGKWRAKNVDAVLLTGEWADLPAIRTSVAKAFGIPVGRLYSQDARVLTVYGAALATLDDAPTIWDVTPYPLGINCYYGEEELFSTIIAANTPIPTPMAGETGAWTSKYTTRFADQTEVTLDILQYRGPRVPSMFGAERVYPAECELLGSWQFTDLHPPRGGHAPFTVTFAVDSDGILHLQAEETATGHQLTAHVERGIGA